MYVKNLSGVGFALGGIGTPDLAAAVSTCMCGCEQTSLTFACALPLDRWIFLFFFYAMAACEMPPYFNIFNEKSRPDSRRSDK